MSDILNSAASAVGRIGRYFSLVSVVPGLVLVLSLAFLVGLTKAQDGIILAGAVTFILGFELPQWVAIIALAVGIGFVMHPFQYAITQFFEGYWGPGQIMIKPATWRIMTHRRRAIALEEAAAEADFEWIRKAHHSRPKSLRRNLRGPSNEGIRRQLATERMASSDMDFLMPAYIRSLATEKALTKYPENHGRVMPTRLGNILRRHEDRIGGSVGIDAVPLAPYMSRVADQKDVATVSDEGEQMDFALRLCVVLLIVATVYLFALAPRGFEALAAVVPYALAYLAYRGACVAAENYMTAVAVLVHMNRFALYQALHLGTPQDRAQELQLSETALAIVSDSSPRDANWRYR